MRVIITGSTGMVGEGVLHEALNSDKVSDILLINRRSCEVKHPKIKEIIHKDFFDFSSIEDNLIGFNACFHCMGVSSVGKKADEYKRLTYDITMGLAQTVLKKNPDIKFAYVSGAGTDSTEIGKSSWARLKGKTENDLLKLGFKDAYMFRPGYIQPIPGLKRAYKIYKVFAPFYPIWKTLFTKYVITLSELGNAMINVVDKGFNKKVLENVDIAKAAK